MRQAARGEDRQLLPTHEGVQPVDGGNARLDKLLRIAARHRVDWQAVDVHAFVWDNLRTAVNRAAETVEHAAEHILGYAKLHLAAEEAHLAVGEVDARGALEQLDKRIRPVNLQHTAAALFAAFQLDFAQFVIGDVLHVAHQHQGAGDFFYGSVFNWHNESSFLSRGRELRLLQPI